jgi:hypothetical protein
MEGKDRSSLDEPDARWTTYTRSRLPPAVAVAW